ncbi:hypothetical protein RM550_04080 [Streptomyces sp. DSM 41527]|uniref:FAD dependent oxidoreductase domain-containing protein n=1 Tax=Streptomyces mooreae TaxID=3075523 RepID=A0ABU2T292_9ACTN|nr:hypothetical protein [Streptomyces sp. DSM 41527]MDT0454921.1 hypothetical protein [Streptomyces sp. DSM 41527]
MAPTYDVIVLGLGGMGSAAAHHLAARGARVLGLGLERKGTVCTPETIERTVHDHEVRAMADQLRPRIPRRPAAAGA